MIRAALIMAALAAPAHAGPDRVSILLGSHHVDPKMEFNERNLGMFATWERGQVDYSVGAYRNSFNKTSVAATVGYRFAEGGDWSLSAFVGAAHYPEDGRNFSVSAGDVVPIGGLQARYKNTFVSIMPSDGKSTDAVVSFGLTFELGD